MDRNITSANEATAKLIKCKVLLAQDVPFLDAIPPSDRFYLPQEQLSLIHSARIQILGREQGDRRYLSGIQEEEKLLDSTAAHVLCYYGSDLIVAAARLRTTHGHAPWSGGETPEEIHALGDFMYLDRVVVTPSFRKKGIAGALISAAIGFTGMLGLRYLLLSVHATNVAMEQILEAQGFQTLLTRVSVVGSQIKVWLKEIQKPL